MVYRGRGKIFVKLEMWERLKEVVLGSGEGNWGKFGFYYEMFF